MIGRREIETAVARKTGAGKKTSAMNKIARRTAGKSFELNLVDFLGDVVEAEHQLVGFVARGMSGVNDRMPLPMRCVMSGAASQRPFASFRPTGRR
jgi:hypothetical protein